MPARDLRRGGAPPVLDGPFRQAIRPDRRPLFDDACRRAGQILAGVRAEMADACDLGDAMAVPELAYVPAGRPCEDIAARFEELLAEADTAAERDGGAQGNMPEAAAVAAARNASLDLLATVRSRRAAGPAAMQRGCPRQRLDE